MAQDGPAPRPRGGGGDLVWVGLGVTEHSAQLRAGGERLGPTTPQAQEPEEPAPGDWVHSALGTAAPSPGDWVHSALGTCTCPW